MSGSSEYTTALLLGGHDFDSRFGDFFTVPLSKYEYIDLKVATAGFHIRMNYVFTICYSST